MTSDPALDLALLEKTIALIVNEFKAQDKLSELTPRVIRARIEEELQLSEEALKPHKQTIKEIATRYVNEEYPGAVGAPDGEEMKAHDTSKHKTNQKPKSEGASAKKRKRVQEFKSNETIDDSDAESPPVSVKPTKKKVKASEAQNPSKSTEEASRDEKDTEPETTVVNKEKAKREKKREKPLAKPRMKKAAPTKEEESVKRLKSFVLACGVRKVWSKEFAGIEDQPRLQEHKLREILRDLGMDGRLSMEKAKQIKEKRDMEKELADVKEFHDKVTTGPKRNAGSSKTKKAAANSASGSDSEESDVVLVKRKNARQSIMAFLGDQSSDDE